MPDTAQYNPMHSGVMSSNNANYGPSSYLQGFHPQVTQQGYQTVQTQSPNTSQYPTDTPTGQASSTSQPEKKTPNVVTDKAALQFVPSQVLRNMPK